MLAWQILYVLAAAVLVFGLLMAIVRSQPWWLIGFAIGAVAVLVIRKVILAGAVVSDPTILVLGVAIGAIGMVGCNLRRRQSVALSE